MLLADDELEMFSEQRPGVQTIPRYIELRVELLDRARQRRLRHVAFVGPAREIEHPRHREKISDLMHFHGSSPPSPSSSLADLQLLEHRKSHSRGVWFRKPKGISGNPS